jgi:hypothetical protein
VPRQREKIFNGHKQQRSVFSEVLKGTGFRGSQKLSMRAWQIFALPALFFPQSK